MANITLGGILTAKKQSPYHRAIELWGKDSQTVVAMERLAKLIQSVADYHRFRDDFTRDRDEEHGLMENIALDMADVEIMLGQLKVIIDDQGIWDYENILRSKLYSLEALIDKHE